MPNITRALYDSTSANFAGLWFQHLSSDISGRSPEAASWPGRLLQFAEIFGTIDRQYDQQLATLRLMIMSYRMSVYEHFDGAIGRPLAGQSRSLKALAVLRV